MTFFALVVAERVGPRLGPWLWGPLVAAGVFVSRIGTGPN
jgi:hypothetical protein